MESKKFLLNKLRELHNAFPHISIKYKYDEYSEKHIVDIMPLTEYENNAYIEYEADLSHEFDNKFFPQSVMFISADSLTKLTNPEFMIESVITTGDENSAYYVFNNHSDFSEKDNHYLAA
jgi:hypothetical protein